MGHQFQYFRCRHCGSDVPVGGYCLTCQFGFPKNQVEPKPEPQNSARVESQQSVLQRAEETVNGERAKDYGHPRENIERIRQRWSQVVGQELASEQVCLMLVDLKVARLCNTPQHEDSWLDIAGYVRVNEMVKQ